MKREKELTSFVLLKTTVETGSDLFTVDYGNITKQTQDAKTVLVKRNV
ncbi:MAG: hypothetical protein IKX88_04170 [Thermoguttaceae bacterium]|nr:hypothetical protein [Thermoguttaceae bacterium]MBR5757775.1 hypothetical protein [Thermoguttaceae bacterium]